jgi:peptide/nickel transport system permease protein
VPGLIEPAGDEYTLRRKRPYPAIAGFIAIGIIVFLAIFGPLLVDYAPNKPDTSAILTGPSSDHWMGTDQYGRDVFTRVVYAARLDLRIAFSITALSLFFGSLVGGLIGFYGGWVELIVMRVIDVLLAFPGFILALGITAMLGNTTQNVIIAVAIAYFPYYVRIVRGEMLALRESEYAAAAQVVGVKKLRIMLYHLLPNALPLALVQATLTLGWGILDAAGLSFLGVGIKPPTAEWGVLVGDGAQYINSGEWWISVFPGLAILLAVLGFNLAGDWVRDKLERR